MIDDNPEFINSLDEQYLIFHPATFIIEVTGQSNKLGLKTGDKLILNRAILPLEGQLVLVVINNQFSVQRFFPDQSLEIVSESNDFIWGVVIAVIRELRR
jgi:SOS-response transcriptional repressor LexA